MKGWYSWVCYMGVSNNRGGPPKSSILIGFSIIFTFHFGVPLFLETPISPLNGVKGPMGWLVGPMGWLVTRVKGLATLAGSPETEVQALVLVSIRTVQCWIMIKYIDHLLVLRVAF